MKRPSKALLAKWDRKLAASGFEDIEDRRTGDIRADTSKRRALARSPEDREARERYYDAARHALFNEDWTGRERERLVWALHAHGLGVTLIARFTGWSPDVVYAHVLSGQAGLATQSEVGFEDGQVSEDGDTETTGQEYLSVRAWRLSRDAEDGVTDAEPGEVL
jgi:hypothetical protein